MQELRDLEALSLLDEPVRRRLYEYVRERGDAVGREEAAAAAGVSRSLAAFHLDRLAAAGLLSTEYRRLTGRTGRGAGRPAKLYRVSEARFRITLPATRYELAGQILADALEDREAGETAVEAVRAAAERWGQELAELLRDDAARAGNGDREARVRAVLDRLGFEPEGREGTLALRNCPFHELVKGHRELVCQMNHALLEGLVDGLEMSGVGARPHDEPGYCCVEITVPR